MVQKTQLLMWVAPLVAWELVWKGIALWKSARGSQRGWFFAILLLNTVGVLPIIYLWLFQKRRKKA